MAPSELCDIQLPETSPNNYPVLCEYVIISALKDACLTFTWRG